MMKTDNKSRVALDMSKADQMRRGFRGETVYPISKALPLYKGNGPNSMYVHRVRSAALHTAMQRAGIRKHSHVSISFWCGGGGYLSDGKGRTFAALPEGEVLCATCEGRYIGAGLGEEGRKINGRKVMYQPRKSE